MKRNRLLRTLLLSLVIALAVGGRVFAATNVFSGNGYTITLDSHADGNKVAYHAMVKDAQGNPIKDARVALRGRVNGADYRIVDDQSKLEARAMLKSQSDGGSAGEVVFPEKGIWKMELAVVALATQEVLTQAQFDESVGGVLKDEAKGSIMLYSLAAAGAVCYFAYFVRRKPKPKT